MKLFNWMKHYVPKYAVLPLLGCLALNMLVYYGSRLFNLSMTSYDLSLPLDHRIPLVPPFIVVYMLSFVYWWFAYMVIAADSPERGGMLFGEMIGKLICLAFFLILPTQMERPAVTATTSFPAWCDLSTGLTCQTICFPPFTAWKATCAGAALPAAAACQSG